MFSEQSKEVFGLKLNNLFGVFARVWTIKEKGFWEKILIELLHLDFYNFPRIFFEFLISIPLVFSTLELHLLSYSIGSLCGKRDCLWLLDHQVVNPIFAWLCAFPSLC